MNKQFRDFDIEEFLSLLSSLVIYMLSNLESMSMFVFLLLSLTFPQKKKGKKSSLKSFFPFEFLLEEWIVHPFHFLSLNRCHELLVLILCNFAERFWIRCHSIESCDAPAFLRSLCFASEKLLSDEDEYSFPPYIAVWEAVLEALESIQSSGSNGQILSPTIPLDMYKDILSEFFRLLVWHIQPSASPSFHQLDSTFVDEASGLTEWESSLLEIASLIANLSTFLSESVCREGLQHGRDTLNRLNQALSSSHAFHVCFFSWFLSVILKV